MRLEAVEREMISREARTEHEPLKSRFAQFVWRAWARLVAAQESRARNIARRHLATRSDATLRDLGFSPDEIGLIRECREPAELLWYWR